MSLLNSKKYQKIKLLLWKSYHARRYYWKITLLEILVPILIGVYVTWVIAKHSKEDFHSHSPSYKPVLDRPSFIQKTVLLNVLVYTPECRFTTILLKNVQQELSFWRTTVDLKPVKDEDELEKFIISNGHPASALGIIFYVDNETGYEQVPDIFTYEIRQMGSKDTRFLYPIIEKSGPNSNQDLYVDSGFAGIQMIINEQFIFMKNLKLSMLEPEFQAFPYPEYESSSVPRGSVSFAICYSIIITLLALSIPFVNHVTEEKGNGTKALMILHGVNEWIIWFCWFVHAVMVLTVSLTVMAIILKLPFSGIGTEPIRFVPFSVLWLILILYCLANMSFSFMFCAIFHQGAFAGFAFLVVSVIELLINICCRVLHIHSFSLLLCLFPSTAFSKGFDMIRFFEEIGVTFSWQSLIICTDHQNPISLLIALSMLVFDIILYTFLTYYISIINPGRYGIKKSPLYFLESIIPLLKSNNGNEPLNDDNEWGENYEFIEPPSPDEEPSIKITDLYKEFGSFYAVNGVELEIYESEITVLLGHSGAGKTTLLDILAGLILPDWGSITYKGMDIVENRKEFRESLGVSFQEDKLFPYLSIMNHLLFYGMLKGFSRSEVTEEAENYLTKMDMYDERNSWVDNMNDGIKRKLNLMISLMGDPKILLLDQPTFGMDMQSKIMTWDLLMDIRQGRTIISTSRDMHDAEKIASRVAIIESGVLVSYGTVAFLKKTFGAAYELSITTENETNRSVTNFVQGYIPSATTKYEAGDDILFKIQPTETPRFPEFFEDLENSKDRLGILNIELGYTTLEQILLEIGSLSKSTSTGIESIDIISESQSVDIKEGLALIMLQIKTLFKKKFMYTVRTWGYTFARIVLPTIMALLAVRIIELYDFDPEQHVELSVHTYPGAIVMLGKNNLNPTEYSSYKDYVKENDGTIIETTSENILEDLIDFGRHRIIEYRKKLLMAFEHGNPNNPNKILYNHWMLHSLPIAITTYFNMILKNVSSANKMKIIIMNHPIPNVEDSCYVEALVKQKYILNIMLFFVFTFFTVDVLLYFFEFSNMEVTRSLMHLQVLSKVPIGIYWFITFIYDFLFFIIITAIRITLFKIVNDIFHFIALTTAFKILMVIILLFAVSGLLFVYVLSFLLNPSRETLIKLFVLNFLCSVSVLLFTNFDEKIFAFVANFGVIIYGIEIVLLLIPFFNYNLLVIRYIEMWSENTACELCAASLIEQCLSQLKPMPIFVFPSKENPNGLLLGLIFLLVDIVLYFILLYLINAGFFGSMYRVFCALKIENDSTNINDDVRQERDEIEEIKENQFAYVEVSLLVDGLSKQYMKSFQPYVAIENVSFIANRGSCFGILGQDGSGKSTTLKMLATEVSPTSGNSSIEGIGLTNNKKQYVSMIGYCPPTNPLVDEFTGKEMLTLIASLRGISGYDAEILTDQWISFFRLEKYQHRNCGSYSRGSKRKLCIALSLLGNPKVLFLDEPTTDLDPVSTRRLHHIIKQCKQAGLVVVLTSPNMEECEILCDRLTILVRGVMHCIGTPKDLKKNYARGYSVTFKIHYDATSMDETFALEENMANTFNPRYCELIEEQRGLLRYHINDPSVPWSALFRNLEEIKFNNPIIDEYIATNTTLEDIFLTLSQSEYLSDYY